LVIYLIISLIKPRHRMQVVCPIYAQTLPEVEADYFYSFSFLFFFSLSLYFNKFDLILKRERKKKRVRCFLNSGTNLSSWPWKTPSPNSRVYLRMWLRLFFKVIFIRKYIKIIFFYFEKIIFNINTSKWLENTKKVLI